MNNILIVAKNVFRESIRDRILYVLLAFGLITLSGTALLSDISMRQEQKVIYDFGLGAITFFSILITIFISSYLLYKEIDKGTVHFILTKPISRAQFVIGKWLGTCMTSGMIVALMAIIFCSIVLLNHYPLPAGFGLSIVFLLIEVFFIAALVLLFASFTSPLITTVSTVIITLVGHAMYVIKILLEAPGTSPQSRIIIDIFSYLVPNLDLLNVYDQISNGFPVTATQIGWTILYFASYCAIILTLSCLCFSRKKF